MRFCSLSAVIAALLVSSAPVLFGNVEIDAVPPQATRRVATAQVRVAPDHRDWTYRPGEPVKFNVVVTADNVPISRVPISYFVGPEQMPAATKNGEVSVDGLVIDGGTLNQPGFLRCSVTAEVAGRTYRGAATAAFSPELIKPTQTEPADFDGFWKAAKDELAAIPVDAQVTLMPEACTGTVNVYHVRLRNVGESWQGPAHVYGILCEPKVPGKYPALLRVPGAGVRAYSGDIGTAEQGAITFEIGVHGIPVNLPKPIYDDLLSGPLNSYWLFNLDDPKRFYFYRVVLGCLRANDFLSSHPQWDGKTLVVAGASQGGQLSITTAALDQRVTGVSAIHPAFCDLSGSLHGRAAGWPQPFRPDSRTGAASFHATPAKIATTTYYDTVNFARRLKVPGYYNWGYNDESCPPTSTFAAYNVITAPKHLDVMLELGHSYPAEQQAATGAWILKALGIGKK